MKSFTKGTPLKVILLFAVPLCIGQLFQLCYSLVDTRIIGGTLGEASLAAVGATTALSDMLIEFLNGIICGFGIVISMFFGAGDDRNMKRAISGSILFGVAGTVLISAVSLAFLSQIFGFLNISEELTPESSAYIRIILAGLTATTLYSLCAAVLRAIGDSFTPLVFLVISNLLNILPEREVCRQLLPTGLSMGFMISFVTLGSLALQTSINTFGTDIIVAHTAARKMTMLFMIPFFVLGTTLTTYCGQNLGAGEYGRIRKGIKDTVLLSFGWCAVVLLVVYTLSPFLIRAVTASASDAVIGTAALYLKVNAAFYFLPAVICIFRNSMQGFGDTRTPLVSSLIELAGKVAIAYLLAPVIGYMGVIVSETVVWAFMVIPLIVGMARNPIIKKQA